MSIFFPKNPVKTFSRLRFVGFFFVGLLVLTGFFGLKTAFADTLYSQTGHATEYSTYDGYNNVQFLGDGLEGSVNELCFWSSLSGGALKQVYFGYQSTDPLNGSNWAPETYVYQTNSYASYPSSPQRFCVSISEHELLPSKFYFLQLGGSYGSNFKDYGSNNSTSWSTSSFDCKIANGGWGNCGSIKDIYFELNGTPPPADTIELNPISTSTSQQVSFTWNFSLDNATTSGGYYTILEDFEVWKCLSSDSSSCSLQIYPNWSSIIPNSNSGTATTTLLLENGYYQIKFFEVAFDSTGDMEADTHILITEPSNVFLVDSTSGASIPTISIPTSTQATSTIQTTCDSEDGWFSYSICNVLQWVFIPNPDLVDDIANQRATLMTKKPFSYFSLAREKIESISLTSTTTPTLTLSFALAGQNINLKILDFTETEDLVGTSSMDLIYNLIQYGFWLMFLVYAILRISHLEI